MLITMAARIQTPPFTQTNANNLHNALASVLAPLYDSEMTFPETTFLVGGDPPLRFVATGSAAGTRAALNEPSVNVAYLITKATGFAGRRYRGRLYLPAANEAAFTADGRLSAGEITVLQTAATGLFNVLGGSVINTNVDQPVLLHSGAPSTPTTVTAYQAGSVVATQRRRLVRSG